MYVRFLNIIYVKSASKIYLNLLSILVRDYLYKFCSNNDYSTTAKTSSRNAKFYDRGEIATDNAKN